MILTNSILHYEVAFTKVKALFADWFYRRRFFKKNSVDSCVKNMDTPLWPSPTPVNHNLRNLNLPFLWKLPRKILLDNKIITFLLKIHPSHCGLKLPLGIIIWKKKTNNTWGCSRTSYNFSGQIDFEKNIFQSFSMYSDVLMWLPQTPPHLVATLYPQVSWFEQTWIYTIWGCFHTNHRIVGQMVF